MHAVPKVASSPSGNELSECLGCTYVAFFYPGLQVVFWMQHPVACATLDELAGGEAGARAGRVPVLSEFRPEEQCVSQRAPCSRTLHIQCSVTSVCLTTVDDKAGRLAELG